MFCHFLHVPSPCGCFCLRPLGLCLRCFLFDVTGATRCAECEDCLVTAVVRRIIAITSTVGSGATVSTFFTKSFTTPWRSMLEVSRWTVRERVLLKWIVKTRGGVLIRPHPVVNQATIERVCLHPHPATRLKNRSGVSKCQHPSIRRRLRIGVCKPPNRRSSWMHLVRRTVCPIVFGTGGMMTTAAMAG